MLQKTIYYSFSAGSNQTETFSLASVWDYLSSDNRLKKERKISSSYICVIIIIHLLRLYTHKKTETKEPFKRVSSFVMYYIILWVQA